VEGRSSGDVSGGTRSAFGYLYQYAASAEYYLRLLSEHPTAALLVEPTALASRGVAADDDVVDFAVAVPLSMGLANVVRAIDELLKILSVEGLSSYEWQFDLGFWCRQI
jgi:hypothetical protein